MTDTGVGARGLTVGTPDFGRSSQLGLTTQPEPYVEGRRRKVGLALSGGGFRTALFHIGVLLQLARLGILKETEVISMVSGGSIVGAAFYLRLLDRLLKGGPLNDADMVEVVEDLARTFPAGVKHNVRMHAFSSYWANVRMSKANYSRSDRVAELYERLFLDGVLADQREAVTLPRLQELCQGLPEGPPSRGGMPALFINATSLNSGRDWRFSIDTMGEPDLRGQVADIDRVPRFKRPDSYAALPSPDPQNVRLGVAVAASSALPGGLHPMSITGMYAGTRIQLADGGIHDNQGLQSLISTKCTDFIVSDTGGQMAGEEHARSSFLAVLLRTQQILYGRVRQEQLARVSDRRPDEIDPSPLALIHLRKGVPVEVIAPLDAAGGGGGREFDSPPGGVSTDFGVDPSVMELLAEIRTDLDSFSEVEAVSLMSTGYLVTAAATMDPTWTGSDLVTGNPVQADTSLLGLGAVSGYLLTPPSSYLRHLGIGSHRFFKVLRLVRVGVVSAVIAIAGLMMGVWALFRHGFFGVSMGWLLSVLILVGLAVKIPTSTLGAAILDSRWVRWLWCLRNAAITAWPTALWSNLYLITFERLFVWAGSLARIDPDP